MVNSARRWFLFYGFVFRRFLQRKLVLLLLRGRIGQEFLEDTLKWLSLLSHALKAQ